MMYITKGSTISFQPTYESTGFATSIEPLDEDSVIAHPDYSKIIPPMSLRRMTDVIKMSLACALDCVKNSSKNEVGGIIVGSANGSMEHTKNFLNKINTQGDGPIPPTSFILSTHNTMAGQISLALNCKEYNNTHSQNTLSFEHSLLDAAMLIEEGKRDVLVGTADEQNVAMFRVDEKIKSTLYPSTFGATFFKIDTEKNGTTGVRIIDVQPIHGFKNFQDSIRQFLVKNEISPNEINTVYFSSYEKEHVQNLKGLFGNGNCVEYEKFTGSYLTASSFAVHLAYDLIVHNSEFNCILVVNNMLSKNLGLTLLKRG
jgi:Beta-ketoacyl synthase, N-terminal domain